MAINNINNFIESDLCIVSFNMHGYNQGSTTVKELIATNLPDAFLLQEHWLTPANLVKFNGDFPDYTLFGSSALNSNVESGPLIGRPYGGTAILVKNDLLNVCTCIVVAERYVIIKIGDLLCINVYLPCIGTIDGQLICSEVLSEIAAWRSQYTDCGCIIGGDFNSDLDSPSIRSKLINTFMFDNNFSRCDLEFPSNVRFTYINESLNHFSKIDYIMYNNVHVRAFEITDPEVNFSDHVPIIATCTINISTTVVNVVNRQSSELHAKRLRWDRADLQAYYNYTYSYLQPIFSKLTEIESGNCSHLDKSFIDSIYEKLVDVINLSAEAAVPVCRQNFFKFWWNQELDALKENSIESHKLWVSAGRPRFGSVFIKRNKDRNAYRLAIRKNETESTQYYTNELHEALLNKRGNVFWKCFNSKFGNKPRDCQQVDGIVDPHQVADNFSNHFQKSCTNLSGSSSRLADQYNVMRSNYVGDPILEELSFDAQLIEQVINNLKRGKAAGLDNLTAEHLQHCHPLLPGVLAKLFNYFIREGYVPEQFGKSYTVPLRKANTTAKHLTVDDFRGISISPVISKVFEHCVISRYDKFLKTNDNQFGFKKTVGCSNAIYTVRCVVDKFINNGSTVNLCAIDISKAFDRLNHHGLFIKLMQRSLPSKLLSVFENWFDKCFTCVRWGSVYSMSFKLNCGIRQGGVLSPHFFAVYIDGIVAKVKSLGIGCHLGLVCFSIFLYADDILLLAPSITALQKLVNVCEGELHLLDLAINSKKTVCTRIGSRWAAECGGIVTSDGNQIHWVEKLRYLGVFILSGKSFRCCFDNAKKSFYRAFNAVFGKIGRIASEEVILSLIKTKCLPCLLFCVEVCPLNKSELRSLNFTVTRVLMKLFRTFSNSVIQDCQHFFNFSSVDTLVRQRTIVFLRKYCAVTNSLTNVFGCDAQRQLASAMNVF
jgi:exonuclease III